MDPVTENVAASGFVLTVVQTLRSVVPDKVRDIVLPWLAILSGVAYTAWLAPVSGLTLGQQVLLGVTLGSSATGAYMTLRKTGDAVKSKLQPTTKQ